MWATRSFFMGRLKLDMSNLINSNVNVLHVLNMNGLGSTHEKWARDDCNTQIRQPWEKDNNTQMFQHFLQVL